MSQPPNWGGDPDQGGYGPGPYGQQPTQPPYGQQNPPPGQPTQPPYGQQNPPPGQPNQPPYGQPPAAPNQYPPTQPPYGQPDPPPYGQPVQRPYGAAPGYPELMLTAQPGYGGKPPKNNRNLLIALIAVVVVAGAAIALVIGLKSGDSTTQVAAPPTAARTTPTTPSTPTSPTGFPSTSTAAPSTRASSAPTTAPTTVPTSASPTGNGSGAGASIGCADISGYHLFGDALTLTTGGTVPANVPAPSPSGPGAVCTGKAKNSDGSADRIVAAAWPGQRLSTYVASLRRARYTCSVEKITTTESIGECHIASNAYLEIVLANIKGQLAVVYDNTK